ncbi:MAG: class F sortase [Patescibacteria group bacterium]
MKFKKPFTFLLLVFGGLGVVSLFIAIFPPIHSLFAIRAVGSIQMPVVKNTPRTFVKTIDSGLPVRLKIPKIKVNSAIEQVGIKSTGAMEAPQGRTSVGWFKLGVRPGDKGTAVIAGHYGWKNSLSAAFDNVSKLQKGDTISVEDASGKSVVFIVRKIQIYSEDDDAADVFSSKDGKVHLNLITCDGVWDSIKKSYSNRLVVFADKQ